MKPKLPCSSPPEHWKAALRSTIHPVLMLLALNVAISFYAFSLNYSFAGAVFGVLLPGAFLAILAQTLSSRIARSNHGVFPRAERPVVYWIHVFLLTAAYLFTSAAPLHALYFPATHP